MEKNKIIKNPFINNLQKQKKLLISIDKKNKFNFKIGNKIVGKEKIIFAGPCSVESRNMIINFSKTQKTWYSWYKRVLINLYIPNKNGGEWMERGY